MPKIRRKSIENDFLLIFFLHAERGCRSIIYFNDFATPSCFIYLISMAKQKAAAQYTAAFYVLILSYNPLFTLAVMIFGKILHTRYIFR